MSQGDSFVFFLLGLFFTGYSSVATGRRYFCYFAYHKSNVDTTQPKNCVLFWVCFSFLVDVFVVWVLECVRQTATVDAYC